MEETKFENGIVEENNEVTETQENSGVGVAVAAVVGVGLAVAAGVTFLVYKGRDKIEARTIAKLEKKGYTVTKVETKADEKNESTKAKTEKKEN